MVAGTGAEDSQITKRPQTRIWKGTHKFYATHTPSCLIISQPISALNFAPLAQMIGIHALDLKVQTPLINQAQHQWARLDKQAWSSCSISEKFETPQEVHREQKNVPLAAYVQSGL